MDANTFLNQYVTEIPFLPLSLSDQKKIQFQGLEQLLYEKLTSSKYRSLALPPELQQKIKEKIHLCVTRHIPIHITVPFGGYKKWQLKTAPHLDWSEVFNVLQLREYLSPVAALYKPGVILEYFSDEIFISRMNNIPQQEVDTYNSECADLFKFIQRYTPHNMKFKFSKIRDFISEEELFNRFDKIKIQLRKDWQNLPKEEQERRLNKARRNYKGEADTQTIFEANLIHDAFLYGDWDLGIPWAFDTHMIAVGFRYTKSWGIPLKSSRSSATQFWVGTGVLLHKESEYVPTILTLEQFEEQKGNFSQENVSVFPTSFKTLQNISVLNS